MDQVCNFMVSSVTMSGCPGWLSHLPVMTETPASGVSMCHSPCGKPKHDQHVWGDPDGRVISLSHRSPTNSLYMGKIYFHLPT